MAVRAPKRQRGKIVDVPGPIGMIRGAAKLLTKGEKSIRKTAKKSIRELVTERDIGFSRSKAEATGIFSKKAKTKPQIQAAERKFESSRRKSLRSDIRDLAKVVGEKEAAKFMQKAGKESFSPKAGRVKPRPRIKKLRKKK